MSLSIRKIWDVVCDAYSRYPAALPGSVIMNYHIPAYKPSEPDKPSEPETVTLANGRVVPAPKEGVNVYDPTKDEYDCAEVSLYTPKTQSKVEVPALSLEQAARWCP